MSVIGSAAIGLVGGIVGAIIMTAMESKMKAVPPAILAEKFLGDAEKKPMIMLPRFAIWGLIYGVVVGLGYLGSTIGDGLTLATIGSHKHEEK